MKKLFYMPMVAALLLVVFLSCSDYVSSVDALIDRIEDERLNDEAQINFVMTGVKARFAQQFDNMCFYSSLLSDEGIFDSNVPNATYPSYNEMDQNIQIQMTTPNTYWSGVCGFRFHADNLIERMSKVTFSNATLEKNAKFTAYFYGGVARYFLGTYFGLNENQGGGVISSETETGVFIPTAQMYDLALEKFAIALDVSPDAYTTRVIHSVMARVYLFDGDYANARTHAAAGMVSGDDPFQALYSVDSENGWYWAGGNGRTQVAIDPRFYRYVVEDNTEGTIWDQNGTIAGNVVFGTGERVQLWQILGVNDSLYNIQNKFANNTDPIDFMSWQENELMLAELDLRDGNAGSALTHINNVRASHGLANKGAADMNLLIEERDKELFCQGMRLPDQRRFNIWHLPSARQEVQHEGWKFIPIPYNERDRNDNIPMRTI